MRTLLALGLALASLPPMLLATAAQAGDAAAGSGHWAFSPPRRPTVPPGAQSAIDYFILKRLGSAGLGFAPEAGKRTLLRRVSFDLTGLPPSADEVQTFLEDRSPGAYARAVDRLLASPAYGERWAQHWLDIVRFAESDGFEHDAVRPRAWRYRDWVIGALNADMPYDRFVQLQLAADEIAAGDGDAQVATGFLLAGPDMPDINLAEERRHNFLNGITSNVGATFLSLTLECAQCHDHRTDPVSTADFYRLRAIFANTISPERNKPLGDQVREPGRTAPASFVMTRGGFDAPGEAAEPAFPPALNHQGLGIAEPPEGASSSMRRSALASWLTRSEHPLTARVIVNRLWQHHFGTGIVPSPGDFGTAGQPPSHPELLDWLATELPRRGWSLKEIHRLMVTSRCYRQASRGEGAAWQSALAIDPNNALISRMPRRRLEGEAIRDSFLAISGRLNRDGGGPSVRPPLPHEVTSTLLNNQWTVTPDPDGHRRRSIYIFVRRNLRYPIFDVFDRPDSNLSCSRRSRSTTAPQSLTLLNSAFSLDTARALATRLASAGGAPGQRIDLAYRLVFSRPPDPSELALGLEFLTKEASADDSALSRYCLALLNTNEAIYID